MQQAIHNTNEKQGKGCAGRRDLRHVPIADLTRDEIRRMRFALSVLHAWNSFGLLAATPLTKERAHEMTSKALGIQEDVA
jgi:hypothetical protein